MESHLGCVPDRHAVRFGLAGPQPAGCFRASETVAEAAVTPASPRETCWGVVLLCPVTTSPPGWGVGRVWAARPPGGPGPAEL